MEASCLRYKRKHTVYYKHFTISSECYFLIELPPCTLGKVSPPFDNGFLFSMKLVPFPDLIACTSSCRTEISRNAYDNLPLSGVSRVSWECESL